MDDRTPVIVGVGQVQGAEGAAEPVDLVVAAALRAFEDCGTHALPVELVALTKIGTQRYRNAPRRVAQRIGRAEARTLQVQHGGHTTQVILCQLAEEIAAGRLRGALLAGGELGSLLRSGRSDSDTGTPVVGGEPDADAPWPDLALGDDLVQWVGHPHEVALGIAEPIQMYPLMETALGAALGRSREEHVASISRLWSRMSEVAARNPYAADRRGYSPDEIARSDPSNRHVGFPYTKLMNSNQFVDQGAAILLCSVGVARALGIAPERWVFPWAGVSAHEPFVSERWHLHESRALAVAGRALEERIGRRLADAELVDLYACFPFAVQAQARALALASDAVPTLTGGMRFAGGPWNNYGTHMVANVVTHVRARPEALAIASTNGGFASRFCVVAYGGRPNPDGFRPLPAPFADPGPRRPLVAAPSGHGRIEGYTIPHDRRRAPSHAIAACRLADGARAWARIESTIDVEAMLAADPIGWGVEFGAEGARLVGPGGVD
ncbi:MAG: hypothetical protein R3F35_07970 [Myxococcota bacterium]